LFAIIILRIIDTLLLLYSGKEQKICKMQNAKMCKIKFHLKNILTVLFRGKIFLKIRWYDEWDF